MEFVKQITIEQAEIASAGAAGTVERTISVPAGARRWTLIVVPEAGPGSFDNPDFNLQYQVGIDSFADVNPAASGVAEINKANTITREDVVNKMRVQIINPLANIQDGDTTIQLFIDRGA